MATLGAHSMLLSQEGTGTPNVCIKPGLTVRSGDLRFNRTRGFKYAPTVVVLKVLSTTTKPTRLHLLRRPYRHSCNLGWQHNQGKGKGKGYSSPPTINLPRVSSCFILFPTS